MHFKSLALLSILGAYAGLASAHCKITSATGDKGGQGSAIGIVPGSGNSETDVTIFSNGPCGVTPGAGANNIQTGTAAVLSQNGGQLPQVSAGGSLSMTLHQVNADGAGPMTCSISTDATGKTFTNLQVTTNLPGTNGRSTANNQNFPLVAAMPAGLSCTGTVAGVSNVCMVACKNPVGPFGGCVPVQLAGSGSNTGAAGAGSGTGTAASSVAAAPVAASSAAAAPAAVTTGTTGGTTGGTGNTATGGNHKANQSQAAAGGNCKREVEWEA